VSEARDMERAALTAMEAARDLRSAVAAFAEERRLMEWAAQRISEERGRLEEVLRDGEKAIEPGKPERGNLMRFICLFRGHRWADWIDNGGRRVCARCDYRRVR